MDSACSRLNSTPWHNIGMDHNEFETAFAAATSIGSVLGTMVGVRGGLRIQEHSFRGLRRLLVAGLSLWISGPVSGAIHAALSLCFVGLALGGLFGEVYYAQAMAVLAEIISRDSLL